MAERLAVHSDPDVLSGMPVFYGTRVPAQALLDHLEDGETLDGFLEGYPSVTRQKAIAFLEQAGSEFSRSPQTRREDG